MRIKNYLLVKRFPFLKPKNVWTGLDVEDYNYSYTWLDDIPDGWRKAFGIKICKEIKKALLDAQKKDPKGGYDEKYITTNVHSDKKIPYLYGYQIVQIKEKYGELRWYDKGAPKEVHKIIDKYSKISQLTCITCGKPATKVSVGWISPYCNECAKKIEDRFVDIKVDQDEE